jgi:hypothetical protein
MLWYQFAPEYLVHNFGIGITYFNKFSHCAKNYLAFQQRPEKPDLSTQASEFVLWHISQMDAAFAYREIWVNVRIAPYLFTGFPCPIYVLRELFSRTRLSNKCKIYFACTSLCLFYHLEHSQPGIIRHCQRFLRKIQLQTRFQIGQSNHKRHRIKR